LKTLRSALGKTQAEIAEATRMAQGDVEALALGQMESAWGFLQEHSRAIRLVPRRAPIWRRDRERVDPPRRRLPFLTTLASA
jgi:transcriptional regulator with XRE-family HTH domain